ncbi:MAG: protein phosphatase 2C domain-containing protein [Anaerolineales bacterium]|nr:protein phosphatase 2C domain-containing protein [Anaerolineales bacterium]
MIRTETPHLQSAAATHPGETGKNNEDSNFLGSFRLERDARPAMLAIVADGIGGHYGGEVASQLTVDVVVAMLSAFTGREPVSHMRVAITQASRQVVRMAQENPALEGMGSTIALAWVLGDRLYGASVGDSRIYLLDDGGLHQITTDHTWVQEAIDHAVISPEEAHDHPHAHVLRRYIGSQLDVEPDLRLRLGPEDEGDQGLASQGVRLKPGSQVLLCSDGLTDLVRASEIEGILQSQAPEPAVQSLVELARNRGGHDNITVIVLAMPPPEPPARKSPKLGWLLALVIAIPLLVILTGFALGALALLGWLPW